MKDVFADSAFHPGHHSIRLKGYDYSSKGLYLVTICAHQKKSIFGSVLGGHIELSGVGRIVHECWLAIPLHFAGARLNGFVIMPNHLHGIVEIFAKLGRSSAAPLRENQVAARSLGAIVRSFKAAVTKRAHVELRWTEPVWQRNYFERVLRAGEEFADATQYIAENPLKWEFDRENQNRRRERG